MKKLISVAVILLFIGLAFAPNINANIQSDFVEFTTEVCGMNGVKQTVKLTQQQADEVEALFKSIREQLNTTESREDAEKIFKDAVVELDKYGLLGELSVKQTQRLLTGGNYKSIISNLFKKRLIESRNFSENVNIGCLTVSQTRGSIAFPFSNLIVNRIVFPLRVINGFLLMNIPSYDWDIFAGIDIVFTYLETFASFALFLRTFSHPVVWNAICYGAIVTEIPYGPTHIIPAEGWIETNGLLGKKSWDGEFYGQISLFTLLLIAEVYFGIRGFSGLVIYDDSNERPWTYALGFSFYLNVDYERPEFPYADIWF